LRLAIMYFEQHIILPPETQIFIYMLIFVLFLIALAFLFVGYQLGVLIQTQSKVLGVSDRVQAGKVGGKGE
jgi:hypothetical protein